MKTSSAKPKSSAGRRKVSGPDRGTRYKGNQLREAVRRVCLEEFARTFGTKWKDPLARGAHTENIEIARAKNEREARRALVELRSAMSKVVALVKPPAKREARPPTFAQGGTCFAFLSWWAPQVIEPILERHVGLRSDSQWEPIVDSERARLVHLWTNLNLLNPGRSLAVRPLVPKNLQMIGEPASRFLSPRELAIISLLSGQWPSAHPSKEYTAADIVDLEERAIRKLLPTHGKFWKGPGGRDYHRNEPLSAAGEPP
jgi:hypothetical protein